MSKVLTRPQLHAAMGLLRLIGISQSDFAARADVSRSFIVKVMGGRYPCGLPPRTSDRMAAILASEGITVIPGGATLSTDREYEGDLHCE